MKTADALAYFDGKPTKLAAALDIEPPSVYDWGEFPPPLRQIQLEQITRGKLKAERDVFASKKSGKPGHPKPRALASERTEQHLIGDRRILRDGPNRGRRSEDR